MVERDEEEKREKGSPDAPFSRCYTRAAGCIEADVDVAAEQLFNHLLDKATRLTAGGGRVSITTREDVDEELSLLPKELAQLLRRY